MGKYSDKAASLFKSGYNCAQSVLCAFCEVTGQDYETAVKIGSSLGAGMGRMREVCGAVSGMFIVAGLLYGNTDPNDYVSKSKHYKLIQEIAAKFKEKNGSIICRELLGLTKKTEGYIPEKRTDEYYAKRPCAEIVYSAAEIIENMIESKKENNKKD